VQVHPGEGWPSFSLIVEEKDGQRYRRTYAFQGFRVRLTGKQPWNPPAEAAAPYSAEEEGSAPAPRSKSWPARLWDKLRSLGGR